MGCKLVHQPTSSSRFSRVSIVDRHFRPSPNKQLQRTVTRRRGDTASAPFHYALAVLFTRQRAAAELRL
jgi:hypothetical protein